MKDLDNARVKIIGCFWIVIYKAISDSSLGLIGFVFEICER